MMRTRLASRAATLSMALAALCPSIALSLSSLLETSASASVSLAATWDGLLHESVAAAVVTSVESRPVWENGRIYTYTRVHVDRPVAGALGTGSEAWVRTMGGIVGKVGQIVEGEASFAPGESSLLFLHAGPVGAYVVTARGQGQFPVVADGVAPAHLVKSNSVGMLLDPRGATATAAVPAARLAADVVHGRLVDDVARDVAAAWGAAHAR
jgi:hypothetical protein